MGKSKDKKKKGKGMEKTIAKTEKKIQKNIKKELEEIGEDDVEAMIAAFAEKEKEINQVKEEALPAGKAPSRRGGATFNLLPEREELILFGGEFFNGHKVAMYNDLYIYSLKKKQWVLIKAPNGPPPRTFHQSVVISRNGGELWVFGGEFSSPSQSQFYHYNDLWCFSFQTKQWTKIVAPNGPSARSGHRMCVFKKYLVVFGGYYDNLRNCRFYNDTYLFNLETNRWEEIKYSSIGLNDQPSPRSACQLSVCNKNNSIVLYGGFSKEKLKKDKERGVVHSDMFTLTQEIKKGDKIEWTWKKCKQGGMRPTERISFSMVTLHDDSAILFGGVFDLDNDEEEESNSVFFNDMYKLDLENHKWSLLSLRGKKETKVKKAQKSADDSAMNVDENENESDEEEEEKEEEIKIEDLKIEVKEEKKDDVFQLSYAGPSTSQSKNEDMVFNVVENVKHSDLFVPHARRSAYIQFHKGVLYLYGGKYENKDDKEITFNDMYSLNLKKLDEWKTLIEDKELESLAQKDKSSDDESEEGEDSDDDDDEDDSDMEIDAPNIEPNESLDDYFKRTTELWLSEASSEFPNEKSQKVLNKMAYELCSMFWGSFKKTESAKKDQE